MFVFGTRPEAIKLATVIKEMEKHPDILEPIIVVTGQHRQMLDQVLRIFDIDPDYDLEIMEERQTISRIVTKSMQGLEEILLREKPDMLMVQGDTSTTFAAALAAFYYKVPIGYVEAGLRTFDKWNPYPEEMNRKLTTGLADIFFPPTRTSVNNLFEEKVPLGKIYLTGNTVIDALLTVAKSNFDLGKEGININKNRKLVLVTTHRRENWGEPLKKICFAIEKLAQKFKSEVEFIIPMHKNPLVRNPIKEVLGELGNVKLIEPLDYEPFVHLMKASYLILTDSGGVQEEAPSLGKPVLVLREKTERPEAVGVGAVRLVGTDEKTIFDQADLLLTSEEEYRKMSRSINPYGDGKASERIIGALLYYFGASDRRPEEFNVKALG